ncbi:hypothetical protein OPT61_g8746 [Boeremia exigua]|uniref:Uncharacterized protein n=1 Tax=Boeremia exigua TaxID=749465 RepID=A0ACC2HYM0_9PLEO|nr:hypothetical protein OPT61_g8746 [Boeremia exigua]
MQPGVQASHVRATPKDQIQVYDGLHKLWAGGFALEYGIVDDEGVVRDTHDNDVGVNDVALQRAVAFAAAAVLAGAVALIAFDCADAVAASAASVAHRSGPLATTLNPAWEHDSEARPSAQLSHRIRQLEQKLTARIAGSTRENHSQREGNGSKEMVGSAWRDDDIYAGPPSSYASDPSASTPLCTMQQPNPCRQPRA